MHRFRMRPAKYLHGKPMPKYLDPKTVLIYRLHPAEKAVFLTIFGKYQN